MNKTILISLVAGGLLQGTLLTGNAAADDSEPAQVAQMPALLPPEWFSKDKTAEALLKAAYDGDLEKLRAALQQGTPVNVKSERDFTPLVLAAMENHLEALKILIAAGAMVPTDILGGACVYHPEVLKLLIDAGADVNANARHPHDGEVQLAQEIDAGADVNARLPGPGGEIGMTPLIALARFGHRENVKQQIENVKLLIAAKADVNARMGWNRTALYFVASQKNPELMNVLLKAGADPNIADDQGVTPLMEAVKAGQTENVKLLIAAKAEVNAMAHRRPEASAIGYALENHDWASAEALLDAGAIVNWASFFEPNNTPLMVAVSTSVKGGNDADAQLRVVQKMIKAGANVNAKRTDSVTALHIAADTGDEAIVKLFIDAGANVNAKDQKGRTPLDVARSDKSPGYCNWDYDTKMCRPPRDKPRSDKVKDLLEKAGAETGDWSILSIFR